MKGVRLLNDTRIKIVEGYDSCKTGMSGEETANGIKLYNETTNTSELFAATDLKPFDVSGETRQNYAWVLSV